MFFLINLFSSEKKELEKQIKKLKQERLLKEINCILPPLGFCKCGGEIVYTSNGIDSFGICDIECIECEKKGFKNVLM